MARPKRYPGETTRESKCDMHIVFAATEYFALRDRAAVDGITISDFVRMAVAEKIQRRGAKRLVNTKLWQKRAARPRGPTITP